MTSRKQRGSPVVRVRRRGLFVVSRVAAQGVCALLAVWVLSGCSALQIAYTFAEDMLESHAEEYLDLSTEQEAHLERQSAALVAWHRRAMLPKYAAFFTEQADIAASGGWTGPQLAASFARFRVLLDETVEGASPFVAAILAGHTAPKKTAYLAKRIAEKNAERSAERADRSPEEAIEAWVERRVERISRFTGVLTEGQVAIIRGYAERGMVYAERWYDNRTKRQDALIAFLRAKPSRDEIARFVHRILLYAHEIVDPDYRQVTEARWALSEGMYFAVLSSLGEEQRRELISTLRSYAEDMVSLAEV